MIYLVILFAVASRLVPHLPNFAAVTALSIFSAVYLPKWQAIALPLAVRFISDLILGFFSWPLMIAVYTAHFLGFFLGLWIKHSADDFSGRWTKIFASGLISALAFFLITNFAFLYHGHYRYNWQGIWQSYINGLPFLRGTLLGDIGYTILLFGSYELARYFVSHRKLLFVI